jgi:hypothetical protein
VRASFAGNGNYDPKTATKTITINPATTSATLAIGSSPTQYSDTVTLTATVTKVAGSVQFKKVVGSSGTPTNVGSPVAVAAGYGSASLTNLQILEAPGTTLSFMAVFTPTDSTNYTGSNDSKQLTVTQEDAAATYTGPMFAFTSSTSTGAVTIPIRATIQDPTALPSSDSRHDDSAGDIRTATVRFVAKDAGAGFTMGQVICTATLTLVNAGDTKTASATCPTNPTFNIGNQDSDSVTLGIVVGGNYLEDTQQDDSVITVSKPYASQFITGGGYLVLDSTTAGTYKGDVGSKTNFGFNVKYNNKGTNLQGHLNTIIRKNGHLYQVKANNLSTLGVSYCKAGATAGTTTGCGALPLAPCTYNASAACPIQATFTASASIQDVTNPAAPVSVEGGATVQFDMVDWGEPGSTGLGPDQLGISVWTKTNALWFSSRWNGSKTSMQPLDGGNLVVH